MFITPFRYKTVRMQTPIGLRVSTARLVQNRYDQTVGESNTWNTDILCQKWQLRNEEVGLLLSFTDPSLYFYDVEYVSLVHFIAESSMIGVLNIIVSPSRVRFPRRTRLSVL